MDTSRAPSPPDGTYRHSLAVRLLPAGTILLALALFWLLGLDRYLNFETLATYHDELRDWVSRYTLLAAAAYMLLYAAMAAASIPGATIGTITGGFLFGTVWGSALTVVAATAGATAVFLAARFAVGGALIRRAGPAMRRMEAGFKKNALSYLLVLRLVPLFPFWVVNLVPAFLGVPLRTYVIGTLLGIVPGSLVFASLGAGLSDIVAQGRAPGPDVLLRPSVLLPLLGLAALAMLPVAWRAYRQRGQEGGGDD